MLVLFGALFRLGRKYGGNRVGLLAVFIAGTMPMLYALSHWFLVECGLTALVCVAVGIVSGFDERARWPKYALLGGVFGLGLLMKMSFPFYVAVPIIYFALRNRTAVLKRKPLTAFAAAVAIVAMPWYLVNFAPALRTALNAGTAHTAKIYDTGDILAWRDIWRYMVNLANTGPALYFLMLFVLGAFFASRLSPAGKKGMLLCALWASPVLFLVLGHYRDLRYAAPLFPAVALGLAILIDFAAAGRGIIAWCLVCGLLFTSPRQHAAEFVWNPGDA
jgi:4-amino-4-deoxy-L-arabinose transferase-like glycosyltransferase